MRGFERGAALLVPTNFAFFYPAHELWWVPEAFFFAVKPEIVGVAGANMQ